MQGNIARQGALTNKPAYGAVLNDANVYYAENDFYDSGVQGPLAILGGASDLRRMVKLQLDYTATADVSGAVGAAFDVMTNQTFRVNSITSVIAISVRGNALLGAYAPGPGVIMWSRINVDSGGTPIIRSLGGEMTQTASQSANPYSGGNTIYLEGLAIGNHTIKVQVLSNVATTYTCRPATYPGQEHLEVQVVEYER